jgi:DNA-3-methyladenine glycosylase
MTKGNTLGSRNRVAASLESRVLPRDFYDRDTVQVARELLGMTLVRQSRGGITAGRIVEVEAYLAESDGACHAQRGCTPSNRAMFGPPGRAYIYPIHSRYCLNAVTMPRGVATAVLIRAVEPLWGQALMRRRRKTTDDRQLANGPAKLCEAFDVDRRLDHWNLTTGQRLWISEPVRELVGGRDIQTSPRIGVTAAQELPLRFFVRDNPFVSGPRRPSPTRNSRHDR